MPNFVERCGGLRGIIEPLLGRGLYDVLPLSSRIDVCVVGATVAMMLCKA